MLSRNSISRRASYYAYRVRAEAVRGLGRMQRRATKDRLIVFDPALMGYHGHHLEVARALKNGLSHAFDIQFYANLRAATRIVAELHAQPVCYDSIYVSSADFRATNDQQHASLTAALRKIDPSELTPRTIFVMHSLTVYQLSGLAEWFTGLSVRHRPKLFLQFQFPLEFNVARASDRPVALDIARNAVDALAQAGTVVFATNTDLLKHQLSRQLGQDWRLMPLPVCWPDEISDIPDTSGPIYGFYGAFRREKGSRILADAIPLFLQKYPDSNFIIQAFPPHSDEISLSKLKNLPGVDIIKTTLNDRASYYSWLGRSHFILLPYDPLNYAVRTSTIFIEAPRARTARDYHRRHVDGASAAAAPASRVDYESS